MQLRTKKRNKNNAWIPGWRLRISGPLARLDTPFLGILIERESFKFGSRIQFEIGPKLNRKRRGNIFSRAFGFRFSGLKVVGYRTSYVCLNHLESFQEMVEGMIENAANSPKLTGRIQGAAPFIDFEQGELIKSLNSQKNYPPKAGPNHRPLGYAAIAEKLGSYGDS